MLELIKESELIFRAICWEKFNEIIERSTPIKQDVCFCQRAYEVNSKTLKFMGNAMKKNIKK